MCEDGGDDDDARTASEDVGTLECRTVVAAYIKLSPAAYGSISLGVTS